MNECFYCGRSNDNLLKIIDFSVFLETTLENKIRWLWDCHHCKKTNYTLEKTEPELIKEFQVIYNRLKKK